MNFSFILPTRERPQLLSDLCNSLDSTAADKSNFEMIAAYDLDDTATCNIMPQLEARYPWFKSNGRNRSNNISKDYHNWLKDQVAGDYVIICNDDTVMRTYHWDVVAMQKITNYLSDKPDGIFYGWIADSLLDRAGGVGYCCFPMLSKKAIEIIGYAMHPYYTGWNADIHLYRLFQSIDRVLDLSEVWIDHISYHSGKRERDATSYNMQNITGGNGGVIDFSHEQNLLLSHMQKKN